MLKKRKQTKTEKKQQQRISIESDLFDKFFPKNDVDFPSFSLLSFLIVYISEKETNSFSSSQNTHPHQ